VIESRKFMGYLLFLAAANAAFVLYRSEPRPPDGVRLVTPGVSHALPRRLLRYYSGVPE